MRRFWISGLAAVLGLLAIGLAAVLASSAFGSRHVRKTYYPPLLHFFTVYPIKHKGVVWQYNSRLLYGGGLPYKALAPHDEIPAMRVQVILPAGMKLDHYNISAYGWRASGHKGNPPMTDQSIRKINGLPTWTFLDLSEGLTPLARFWIRVPKTQTARCFKLRATAMTRNTHGKLVRISHSPVQTAKACVPTVSG